jgi:hypothetical protein
MEGFMSYKMWPPKDMLHAVLTIHPAPYFSHGWKRSNLLTDVLWRVTRIDDGVMIIETLSGALGLRLPIYLRHEPRFQPEDLHQHVSFKQGVLRLKRTMGDSGGRKITDVPSVPA